MEPHELLDPSHIGQDFEDLEQRRLDTLCDLLFECSHLAPRDEPLGSPDTPWRDLSEQPVGWGESSSPTNPLANPGASRSVAGLCPPSSSVRRIALAEPVAHTSGADEDTTTLHTRTSRQGVPRAVPVSSNVQSREDRTTAFRWRVSLATLFTGLFIAALCFIRGASAPIEQTRAIEDIRPGHKVIVDAPAEALATDVARLNEFETSWNASTGSLEIEGVADPLRELNEATVAQLEKADYRLVLLQAKEVWEDGTYNEINVQTLQPWQWLHENEVHVGGEAPLPLETVEMNLPVGMTGKVLDILACPTLERGAGRTVLTTVNRLARGVIELTLRDANGKEETLRPTDEHLFYSASQGDWLSAGELQPGEHLDGVHGTITVAAITPLEGTHRVYNMTVQGEHLYRVAECGVLVHNNYNAYEAAKKLMEGLSANRFKARYGHELIQNAAQRGADFKDVLGKTYDHMGFPGMAANWAKEKSNFFAEIEKHLRKADNLVIDLTGFPKYIRDEVAEHVLKLSDDQVDKIFPLGF